MEKWVLIMIMSFIITSISAQDLKPKQIAAVKAEVEELAEIVGFDDEKKASLLEIQMEAKTKGIAIANNYTKGTEEFKLARREAKSVYSKAFKELCSKEEFAKWREYKKSKNKN